MIMKFLKLAIFLLLLSCVGRQNKVPIVDGTSLQQPDSMALILNNKGVYLMGQALMTDDSVIKKVLYDSALIYLEDAIREDSQYVLAYTNKSQVLRKIGNLKASLEPLEMARTIDRDLAEVIMAQGFTLEKMGDMELAMQKYREALVAFEKRLHDRPNDIKVQLDIAFLYIFLEDQNKAVDEVENLIIEKPDMDDLKEFERYVKEFDRKKFIEGY